MDAQSQLQGTQLARPADIPLLHPNGRIADDPANNHVAARDHQHPAPPAAASQSPLVRNGSDAVVDGGPTQSPVVVKTPRKRNKPSLSCEACTVKKTKCDRTRPVCFACIKRRSECHYSQLADLIEESHRSADGQKSRRKSSKVEAQTPSKRPLPTVRASDD